MQKMRLNDKQRTMTHTMTRYAILSCLAIFCNLIFGAFYLIRFQFNYIETNTNFLQICGVEVIIGAFVNICCIYLNFGFQKENYNKYCFICHRCVHRIFEKQIMRQMDIEYKEYSQTHTLDYQKM